MPVINKVGRSAHTPFKQEQFSAFLAEHISSCRGIAESRQWERWEYCYFDFYAGCGFDPAAPEVDGSPIIAIRTLIDRAVPFRAFLFEQERDNIRSLQDRLIDRGLFDPDRTRLFEGRFQDNVTPIFGLLKGTFSRRFGLAYADPNTITPQDMSLFDVLAVLGDRTFTRTIDLLLHMPATGYKRVAGAAGAGCRGFEKYRDAPSLDDMIRRVDKPAFVSQPETRHQWSFVFWCRKDDPRFAKRRGWRSVDDPIGRHWLDKITMGAGDFAGRKPEGFLFDPTGS